MSLGPIVYFLPIDRFPGGTKATCPQRFVFSISVFRPLFVRSIGSPRALHQISHYATGSQRIKPAVMIAGKAGAGKFVAALALVLVLLTLLLFFAWSNRRKRLEPQPPLHATICELWVPGGVIPGRKPASTVLSQSCPFEASPA